MPSPTDPRRPTPAATDWAASTEAPTVEELTTPLQPLAQPGEISPETLSEARHILRRCDQLAALSADPEGIERVSLSREHRMANTLAATWMQELGMRTRQDAVGNLWGRIEGRDPGLPALVLGSHLDTVPGAGRYDGVLGVLLALHVVHRVQERWHEMPVALEVVAFTDEEGTRFGTALMGSRAVAGDPDDAWWTATDARGVSVPDALRGFGLSAERIGDAARDPASIAAYLEAHIEQRPFLERAGQSLGVVTGIAGARRMRIRLRGEARHAGTPYDLRHDALLGASRAITAIMDLAERTGASATVGHIAVAPDAVNVVPGSAEFSLDYRTDDDAHRDAEIERIRQELLRICTAGGLELEMADTHRAATVTCAPGLRAAVEQGITETTGEQRPLELFSVAGHDAMAMAGITDMAMMFIRCRGGISHNAAEAVTLDDVARALDAFERAALLVAVRGGGGR